LRPSTLSPPPNTLLEHSSHQPRFFQAQLLHPRIHRVCRQRVNHKISGGVIAQYHHQRHAVAESQSQTVGELGENACASDFLLFRQQQFIRPLRFSSGNAGKSLNHYGDFDSARSRHLVLSTQAVYGARVQVLREEADFTFELRHFSAHIFV
jgi:hypothetical protein